MLTRAEFIDFATACGHEICSRCQCCDLVWERCDNCGGEGLDGHDCGEDVCCCDYPEENESCDICGGGGGWTMCLGRCDAEGKHLPR